MTLTGVSIQKTSVAATQIDSSPSGELKILPQVANPTHHTRSQHSEQQPRTK
jgi:hypothetical protein